MYCIRGCVWVSGWGGDSGVECKCGSYEAYVRCVGCIGFVCVGVMVYIYSVCVYVCMCACFFKIN